MNEPITVHKLDARGREVWAYHGTILSQTPTSLMLAATYDRNEVRVGDMVLCRGDLFKETFFRDRWYNVFAVYDPAGPLKGWYCNVTRPARIEDGHVFSEDLALDVVVLPDGRCEVLDEDEFAQLKLSDAERQQVRSAISQLLELACLRQGPFADFRWD